MLAVIDVLDKKTSMLLQRLVSSISPAARVVCADATFDAKIN